MLRVVLDCAVLGNENASVIIVQLSIVEEIKEGRKEEKEGERENRTELKRTECRMPTTMPQYA
jgi:hypothetical protein